MRNGSQTAYLLNPADEREENPKKRRKARRKSGKARRRTRSTSAHKIRRRRGRKAGYHRRKSARRISSHRRSRGRRRSRKVVATVTASVRRANGRRRRGHGRRRRNPGLLSMGGGLIQTIDVLPIPQIPLPGLIGKVANGIVQGAAAGGVAFAGYLLSGAVVNFVWTKDDAEKAKAAGDNFKGKWLRPLLFSGVSLIQGGVGAMVAPGGRKATWAILLGVGPAIRAFGGFIAAFMDKPATPGLMADIYNGATGLADYLQVGELYQAGMGDEDGGEGVEDYLQVGDIYQAGMGDGDVSPWAEQDEQDIAPASEEVFAG